MTIACPVAPLNMTLRDPFTISRYSKRQAHNVLVTLTAEGITALGEAAPSYYYGETQAITLAALPLLIDELGDDPWDRAGILRRFDARLKGHAAAKAALEMALWDWIGKKVGQPLYRLLGLDPAKTPRTSFTIGIDTPEVMAEKAKRAAIYPILKVKVGTDNDMARLRAVREARPDALLQVDANAAWTPRQAITAIAQLAPFNLMLVEQPVGPRDLDGLAFVHAHSPLPIFVDESCIGPHDIPALAGRCDGIVIKLMKCGGIGPALEMIAIARAVGLQIMLGCMIESSIAITAAAHLSPLVDYADLDGHLLLADDPYAGVKVVDGKLLLSQLPGLGVVESTAQPAK